MEPDAVERWRRTTRNRLLAARMALAPALHQQLSRQVVARLIGVELPRLATLGFYIAFRGEIDVEPFAERHITRGGSAALPRVVALRAAVPETASASAERPEPRPAPPQPLEFRMWKPGCPMTTGTYGLPYPAQGLGVLPEVLLIPLLGFDRAGYRLGFGGGYYDRTLSNPHRRPLTIGVGFRLSALDTIHPQPHDIPLDIIVTDEATTVHRKA